MFDTAKYLAKLDLKQEAPTASFLKSLHYNHLLKIPFENLDIHCSRPIILDVSNIFQKIIEQGRGGFCYELNGVFYELLKSLGFHCKLIQAQIWSEEKKEFGPKYDHMSVVVELGGIQYLLDVGFGDGFKYPKLIGKQDWQVDGNTFYRIREDEELYYLESSDDMIASSVKYKFDVRTCQFIEFMEMCEFKQKDPQSHFLKNKIISQFTSTGRVTLKDDSLIITELGHKQVYKVNSGDEFKAHLKTYFSIQIDDLT